MRGGNLQGRVFELQQRVDGLQVQVRRNLAVPQHEDDLDQAGDARRAFQVADVGLHRADHQRPVGANARRRAPRARASISIGSPSRVPVPWAST